MFASIGYWICYPFAALVRLFYSVTGSYGVSLILFTLVIKLILLPFQMKSKKSMVRMGRLNGKMQEIQKQYATNRVKQQEEIQRLYQEEGVSPMSGCLWSFIPMPILIALYYIIREPVVYFMNFGTKASGMAVLESAKAVLTKLGESWTIIEKTGADGAYAQIEIIQKLASHAGEAPVKEFFAANPNWINVDYHFLGLDLSTVPSGALSMLKSGVTWAAIGLILIPILSAALQYVVMKITMGTQPQTGAAASTNKTMMMTMPLFSLWIGFTLPAALGVYWIAQSAFSAVQEAFLGKHYTAKLQAEEDERQKRLEADRKVRQEEAKRLQEERKAQQAKLPLKEKQRLAKEAKEKPKKASTNEAGRVADRPYARGRSYQESRYDTENK